MEYQDILYAEADGIATITINRPEKMNAFRGQTCEELIHAFNRAGWNKDIAAGSCEDRTRSRRSRAYCLQLLKWGSTEVVSAKMILQKIFHIL